MAKLLHVHDLCDRMHGHGEDAHEGVACLRAYVTGDSAEPDLASCLHSLGSDEARRIMDAHRDELATIDAARSHMLDSIL